MAVTDRYDVNISGTGVTAAALTTAFEDFVQALRLVTDPAGQEPTGTMTHTEGTVEEAEDVPA